MHYMAQKRDFKVMFGKINDFFFYEKNVKIQEN